MKAEAFNYSSLLASFKEGCKYRNIVYKWAVSSSPVCLIRWYKYNSVKEDRNE